MGRPFVVSRAASVSLLMRLYVPKHSLRARHAPSVAPGLSARTITQ